MIMLLLDKAMDIPAKRVNKPRAWKQMDLNRSGNLECIASPASPPKVAVAVLSRVPKHGIWVIISSKIFPLPGLIVKKLLLLQRRKV